LTATKRGLPGLSKRDERLSHSARGQFCWVLAQPICLLRNDCASREAPRRIFRTASTSSSFLDGRTWRLPDRQPYASSHIFGCGNYSTPRSGRQPHQQIVANRNASRGTMALDAVERGPPLPFSASRSWRASCVLPAAGTAPTTTMETSATSRSASFSRRSTRRMSASRRSLKTCGRRRELRRRGRSLSVRKAQQWRGQGRPALDPLPKGSEAGWAERRAPTTLVPR
jgi:hypothetical protein